MPEGLNGYRGALDGLAFLVNHLAVLIKNLGVARVFPAASGILELNTMSTNQARDIVNRNRKIKVGGKRKKKSPFYR